MEDPHEEHWMAVKRLLCYIKGTFDQAIVFPKHGCKGGLRLMVFSEALRHPPKQRKVSQGSLSSAMQTWWVTLTVDGAPLACSSSLVRP